MSKWHDDRQLLLSIKSAAEASKRLGLRSMIVLQELPDGRWGYTSYGATRALCRRAKLIADEAMSGVEYAVAAADGKI